MIVPDSVDPIVGYRFWSREGNRLRSFTVHYIWPPLQRSEVSLDELDERKGHILLEWSKKKNEAIYMDIFGGFHAYKWNEFIIYYSPPRIRIYGEVHLWGRVEEYAEGYRAQYAYPKCLYLGNDPKYNKQIVELAEEYHIDVKEDPCALPDTSGDGTLSPLKSQLDVANQQYLQAQIYRQNLMLTPMNQFLSRLLSPLPFQPGSKP